MSEHPNQEDFYDEVVDEAGERVYSPPIGEPATVKPVNLDGLKSVLLAAAGDRAEAPGVLAEWTSPGIAYLNQKTGDGRALTGEIGWRKLPLPLMFQPEDAHGSMPTMQSRMAGGINQLAIEGDAIPASGVLDDTETGVAAQAALATGRYGVSIDLGVDEAEYVLKDAANEDGGLLIIADGEADGDAARSVAEENGLAGPDDLVLPMSVDDELFVVTRGTIMGATIVPFAAFADAKILLTASGEEGYPEMIRLAPARYVTLVAMVGPRLMRGDGTVVASIGSDGTLHYHGRTPR